MLAIGILKRRGQGLSESKLPRLGGSFFFRAQGTYRFPPSHLIYVARAIFFGFTQLSESKNFKIDLESSEVIMMQVEKEIE